MLAAMALRKTPKHHNIYNKIVKVSNTVKDNPRQQGS